MATKCYKPIFGKRIRISTMSNCCVPVTGGSCAEVVSDGFISLTLSSEIEDGTEVTQKKANGTLDFQMKAPDSFKRYTVEIEFTGVDPGLLSLVANASPYLDYDGDIAGITFYEGPVEAKFGLELWTGLAGIACPTGADEASGYFVLPCLNAGVLGDITVDGENAVSFTMQGAYTVSQHGWGRGLHDVVLNGGTPDILPSAILPDEPLLILETGVTPPPAACGCQTFAA